MAVDSKDRLWVSSDATGELYVLARTRKATATASGTASGASPSATKKGGVGRVGVNGVLVALLGAVVVAAFL